MSEALEYDAKMMGDDQVHHAFDAASHFLKPVINRDEIQRAQGKSLVESLSESGDNGQYGETAARRAVIDRALDLLLAIHRAFVTSVVQEESYSRPRVEIGTTDLEDARYRQIIHALLDLISLEGIYPSLSSGVGIPLQQRVISVLPAGIIAKQPTMPPSTTPHDESLLNRTMHVLLSIVQDHRSSIQPIIRSRILSDLISGLSDLAFNPNLIDSDKKRSSRNAFQAIIDTSPSAALLPTLSAFLQTETTAWFKSVISHQIARIPMRDGGVLHTILFVMSQVAPSLGQEAQAQPTNGPQFTVQGMMQISRLLSAVPQDTEPSIYFEAIAPQLLELLDGDDIDMRRIASYTIGNGILGKRPYGAPGSIGHSIFIEPIFATLTAKLNSKTARWLSVPPYADTSAPQSTHQQGPSIPVQSHQIILALNRLKLLALQHPNPGLVKRIVYPILLPLWGLTCYSQQEQLTEIHASTMTLLQTYFSISVGVLPLKKLVDHLMWDGGPTWTFTTDFHGQIAFKPRPLSKSSPVDLVKHMDSLQTRVDLFIGLLGSDPSTEERIADIFLHVSQSWLVQSPSLDGAAERGRREQLEDTTAILQKLMCAKVAERLLDKFKDTLSRRPLRVLELIKQVVDGELCKLRSQQMSRSSRNAENVSLSSLANIVPERSESEENELDQDISDSLTTAFSLLSTVLASPEFALSQDIKILLEALKEHLDQLIPLLPSTLAKPATTSSMLLEIQLTSPENTEVQAAPSHVVDLETHRQALADLSSDLPPVQAEGFSLLSKLVLKSSPVLDIPSTLTLLLSTITDSSETHANDEFIYLNAIKLIGTLAARHPRTVVKTLVENYADPSERRTLDQRLKIGESLLRTVQDLGEALAGETAQSLAEGLVAVAGRRGHKPETQRARRQLEEKERRERERQERNRQPGLSELSQLIDDSEPESPEQHAYAASIVAAWGAGASADDEPEDLRIRASALSVLASAVQTNILGLGPMIVSSLIDLAMTTLTLESTIESAVLRRASVVLILDVLKALDSAREARKGQGVGFGFSLVDQEATPSSHSGDHQGPSTVASIPRLLRTLGFVESVETDAIVRGHLRVLIESLEAWMEKSIMWGIGARDGGEPRLELGDRIAGLSIDPLAGRGSGRPRIEEIE